MTRAVFEIAAIIVVAGLMILFAGLYFTISRKQVKLLNERDMRLDEACNGFEESSKHWAEQFQVLHAQLDLLCELSPAFLIGYDYVRKSFFISEAGRVQLNLPQNAGAEQFEALIHADDRFVYEEITSASAENARKADVAASPYIIRLRRGGLQNERTHDEYDEHLTRLKPVYDSNGMSIALVIALIDVAHLKSPPEESEEIIETHK